MEHAVLLVPELLLLLHSRADTEPCFAVSHMLPEQLLPCLQI